MMEQQRQLYQLRARGGDGAAQRVLPSNFLARKQVRLEFRV